MEYEISLLASIHIRVIVKTDSVSDSTKAKDPATSLACRSGFKPTWLANSWFRLAAQRASCLSGYRLQVKPLQSSILVDKDLAPLFFLAPRLLLFNVLCLKLSLVGLRNSVLTTSPSDAAQRNKAQRTDLAIAFHTKKIEADNKTR